MDSPGLSEELVHCIMHAIGNFILYLYLAAIPLSCALHSFPPSFQQIPRSCNDLHLTIPFFWCLEIAPRPRSSSPWSILTNVSLMLKSEQQIAFKCVFWGSLYPAKSSNLCKLWSTLPSLHYRGSLLQRAHPSGWLKTWRCKAAPPSQSLLPLHWREPPTFTAWSGTAAEA